MHLLEDELLVGVDIVIDKLIVGDHCVNGVKVCLTYSVDVNGPSLLASLVIAMGIHPKKVTDLGEVVGNQDIVHLLICAPLYEVRPHKVCFLKVILSCPQKPCKVVIIHSLLISKLALLLYNALELL